MICESCKKREFIENGVYYCPYLGVEIDDDAVIIKCEEYTPYKDEEDK